MTKRTADRATIARLSVAHIGHGFRHQRQMLGNERAVFKIALTCHRANTDRVACDGNTSEISDPINVDDMIGQRKAHVEHGQKRLAASKNTHVLQRREKRERFFNALGCMIGERRRFHGFTIPELLQSASEHPWELKPNARPFLPVPHRFWGEYPKPWSWPRQAKPYPSSLHRKPGAIQ